MRVHLYHMYFRHPDEGGAIRSYHLAKKMISEGFDVLVISAHNTNIGYKEIDGIPVRYFRVSYDNTLGFAPRIKAYFLYLLKAANFLFRNDCDKNYIISSPLTNGFLGLVGKALKGTPFIFEIGDLWPDVPVHMGVIRNSIVQKVLYFLEGKFYRVSSQIVALSPAIKDAIIAKAIHRNKVMSVPNMSDCEFFSPTQKDLSDFRISYIGTLGNANNLNTLLSFATCALENGLNIQIDIMGEGREKRNLVSLAAEMQLENVRFLPFGNHQEVRAQLDQSQAVFVSFAPIDILNSGSPNKLFDALAAGKLIILNFGGWAKTLVEKNECGFGYDPNDPANGIAMLEDFVKDRDLLQRFQRNARKLATEKFDKNLLLAKWIKVFSD